MRRSVARAVVVVVVAVLGGLTPSVGAVTYTFTKIADTSDGFSGFGGGPTINASGVVAFSATLSAGGHGIFTGDGGLLTTIADTSDGFFTAFGGGPAINATGIVAFKANFRDVGGVEGEGIFLGAGGPTTPLGGSIDVFTSASVGGLTVNAGGTVTFFARLHGGETGIFTSSGGAFTTIADTSTFAGGFGATPSINASGTVAFWGQRSALDQGIFTGNGGPLTTIADTSSALASFRNPAINSAGMVAFPATLDAGGEGIFVGSGGLLTTVADTTGVFVGFADASINAGGTVAFVGLLGASTVGIFTGPDPVANKVIATGDLLFGSQVTGGFGLSSQALNDTGQIVFHVTLADGTSGIYRADPIPEANDSDGDGVPDDVDVCPDTVIPESVPTKRLECNRFALTDGDTIFDTCAPKGKRPKKVFTIADTAGCSCEQIIAMLGFGKGHTKFGCSVGAMKRWIEMVNP